MATNLMTGTERMFYDELEKIGAKIEAFIIRSSREWFPDLYGYRITRDDGSQEVGYLEFDVHTYSRVLAIAKGE